MRKSETPMTTSYFLLLRRVALSAGLGIALLWTNPGRVAGQDAPKSGTGIELVGRSKDEPPLYRWSVVDPKTKQPVTFVDGRWGFTPVPPGDYELLVRKYEVDVPYGIVHVAKDKDTRVEVKAGVELVGKSDKEPPFYRWSVVD